MKSEDCLKELKRLLEEQTCTDGVSCCDCVLYSNKTVDGYNCVMVSLTHLLRDMKNNPEEKQYIGTLDMGDTVYGIVGIGYPKIGDLFIGIDGLVFEAYINFKEVMKIIVEKLE
jgi:hypothetical protein